MRRSAMTPAGTLLAQAAAIDEFSRLEVRGRGIRQFVDYVEQSRRCTTAISLRSLIWWKRWICPRKGRCAPLRDNLQSIQLAYREEVTRIFSQFATRGGAAPARNGRPTSGATRATRPRQNSHRIRRLDAEEPADGCAAPPKSNEIFGDEFAAKTVALTFDDGPHPRYTEQVLALLRKYGIRACFFELGKNLGR